MKIFLIASSCLAHSVAGKFVLKGNCHQKVAWQGWNQNQGMWPFWGQSISF